MKSEVIDSELESTVERIVRRVVGKIDEEKFKATEKWGEKMIESLLDEKKKRGTLVLWRAKKTITQLIQMKFERA